MQTKGVAISQIILLVLGIIVLSVVAFLLYSNFTTTTGQIDVQKCRAVATNACTACSIAGGGVPSNCAASTFLLSDGDKACGSAIASTSGGTVGTIDPTTKKTTIVSGAMINCAQYVGGGGLTSSGSQQSNDITGQACNSGAPPTACTTTGGTGLHICDLGVWTSCR